MTPNSPSTGSGPRSTGSGPNRRTFLASSGLAVLAAIGGAPLLTACGGGGSKNEGATTGKKLKDLLPAYVAPDLVTPDIPAENGSAAGFTKALPAARLKTSVPERLGRGGAFTVMAPIWGNVPPRGNPYWTAMDEAAGVRVTWQNQQGDTYGQKLGAVLASSGVPDAVVVPGWELTGKIPSALAHKFADLGPYLSGDEVKKYPNLAAIPTGAWQRSVFGGKLRGLPMPSATTPNIAPFHRTDLFEKEGLQAPTSAREFHDLCKQLNAPRSKVWACGDMTWAAWHIFGVLPEKPYYWKLVDGRLVNRYETDEYLEALEWSRKLYSAGFVHPDAKAETGNIGDLCAAGKVWMYCHDLSDWYGKAAVQRVDDKTFRMEAFDYFAPDGGAPTLYARPPADIWTFISEKADEKTVRDILALANFTAAPYGSKEQRLRMYGVEGVHHTLEDGVLTKNGKGNNEVFSTYEYLASPAPFIAYADLPDVTRGMVGWQQRQGAHTRKPLFHGMMIIEPTRYTELNAEFEDLEKDVVRGRRKVSDVRRAASDWRSGGGDKLRDWYRKLLDDTGDSAS
ncbi:extracellular solute-binding protein [Streptomyces huasconensis]|uniref:Extracellular solute-binding protein n=1 Tax=Streptomyces huasconensis TaxID=1854574 RepID=A0ABV3M1Y3_9ACTN